MENFRRALDDYGLQDLGFTGYRFTWSNGKKGPDNVQERLDQFVATADWANTWYNLQVKNLFSSHSDHNPIILETENNKQVKADKKKEKPFWFERMWVDHEQCSQVIDDGGNLILEGDNIPSVA